MAVDDTKSLLLPTNNFGRFKPSACSNTWSYQKSNCSNEYLLVKSNTNRTPLAPPKNLGIKALNLS